MPAILGNLAADVCGLLNASASFGRLGRQVRLGQRLAAICVAALAFGAALFPGQALAQPAITNGSLAVGQVASPYSETIVASGGTGSGYVYSLLVGSLPAGLSLAANGAITGTPTAGGNFDFTVRVRDSGAQTGNHDFTLTIDPPTVVVGGSTFSPAVRTVAFDEFVTASGGTGPYTFTVTSGSLPTGVSLGSDGHVTGAPTALGVFDFDIKAVDSSTGNGPYDGSRTYHVVVGDPPLTLSPTSVGGGAVGAAYSQTFTGSGGTGTGYGFQLNGGALPAGLSLSSGGLLTGTPTAGGSFDFTVMVFDSSFVGVTRDYTLVVAAPTITVAPTTLADGAQDTAYSQTVTASGGTSGYTFAVSAGALPTGLSLAANGTLTGTPSTAGTFNFTVTATDNSTGTGPYTGAQAYSVEIAAPALAVTPSSLTDAGVAVSYSQTLGATGGTGSGYSFAVTAGALPAGLSLASNGELTGTPTAGGSFPVTITVTDSGTATASRAYTLVVDPPTISVAPSTLPAATQSTAYSQTLVGSGGTSTYSLAVTSGALPGGLSLAADGALTGTPTVTGTFNFTVTATDSSTGSGPYSGSRSYSLVVGVAAPTIAPGSLPAGLVGAAYDEVISATGGSGSGYGFGLAAGALPPGLTLDGDTGRLTGTPTAGGSFNFTVTVTDSDGGSASQAYTLVISAPTIVVDPTSLPDGTEAVAYDEAVTASGGTANYTFAVTAGSLPTGLTLGTDGQISGTPSAPGTFNFTVTATDSSTSTGPYTGSRAYSIVIATPALALSPASLPSGTVAAAYSEALTASGGTGAGYAFAVTSGALPAGLALSIDGELVGTPAAGGAFPITVTVTDSGSGTASRAYTLVVESPAIVVGPAALPAATVNAAYSESLTASGGVPGYSMAISAGSLPSGLSLAAGGLLGGTPTTSGSFNFTVTATDSSGGTGPYSGARTYTLVVAEAPPPPLPPPPSVSAGAVTAEVPFNSSGQTISLAPGGAYERVEVASDPAHGVATISGIVATYIPEAGYSGADSFTYRAVGTGGASAPATVAITVAAAPPPPAATPTSVTIEASEVLSTDQLNINLSALVSGEFTTLVIITPPQHGTLALERQAGPQFLSASDRAPQRANAVYVAVYTPEPGYRGIDTFSYAAVGPGGTSAPAIVSITVLGAPPVLTPLAVTTAAGRAVSVDLTTPAEGGPFMAAAIASLSPGDSGTVALREGGAPEARTYRLEFMPNATFTGAATVVYSLSNVAGTTASSVTVTVQPRPDPSVDPAVRGLNDAQSRAALHFASAQIGNFNRRLERLHSRSDGGHLSLTLAPGALDTVLPSLGGRELGASPFIGQWPEESPGAATGQPLTDGATEDVRRSGGRSGPRAIGSIEGWAGGEITIGRRDSSASQAKLDLTSSGVSAGADLKLTDGFTFGFGAGVGRDLVKVGSDGSKLNAKNWVSAVYGSFSPESGMYLDGVAGIGRLDYDLRRYSTANATFAAGERSGDLAFASATGGWDRVADRYRWSAYGRLEYATADLEAYSEVGAGGDSLTYAKRELHSLVGVLGGKWSLDRSIGENVFAPRLRIELRHEFRDAGAQTIRYSDWLTGLAYTAPDTAWAQNRVDIGLGLAISNMRTWRLDLDLGGEFGRNEMLGTLRIEGAMKF